MNKYIDIITIVIKRVGKEMQIENFLFDLDGTLSDPQKGIISCMQYALSHFGIEEEYDNLLCQIGPPLYNTFIEYLPEEKANDAIIKYRERYAVKGIYENEIYEGIPLLLQEIKEFGGKIFLATSKPEEYALEILKYFGIDIFFDDIVGSSMGNNHETKKDVIEKVFLRNEINKQNSVMIGDREHDVIGANQAGVHSTIGVLYGFGSKEELEKCEPTYIVDTVEDLNRLVMQTLKRGD